MGLFSFLQQKVIEKPAFLYAGESSIHGRGIFTKLALEAGDLIEKAPLVLINKADSDLLESTLLYDYYFMINNAVTPVAVGLGFSSLYNHASPSNAAYRIDLANELIIITAHRKIASGEEITLNYHGRCDDPQPVIFTERPKP